MRRRFERTRERDCGFYGTTSENNLNQDGYKQIKPEVEKPIEEIQAFWDNLFNNMLAENEKVGTIEELPEVDKEVDEIDALPELV